MVSLDEFKVTLAFRGLPSSKFYCGGRVTDTPGLRRTDQKGRGCVNYVFGH